MKDFVIGLDYGTDSARAVLVNAHTGEQIAEAVHNYARWSRGEYCNALESRFRQHPLDYIEALKSVLHGVLDGNKDIAPYVRAISVDTTASTPCLTDENLQPLSSRTILSLNTAPPLPNLNGISTYAPPVLVNLTLILSHPSLNS